jgi:hypothetical protein
MATSNAACCCGSVDLLCEILSSIASCPGTPKPDTHSGSGNSEAAAQQSRRTDVSISFEKALVKSIVRLIYPRQVAIEALSHHPNLA